MDDNQDGVDDNQDDNQDGVDDNQDREWFRMTIRTGSGSG